MKNGEITKSRAMICGGGLLSLHLDQEIPGHAGDDD